jgi:3-methyladenine DNA glycosylase AlkD
MNAHHREIAALLRKHAKREKLGFDVSRYLGSPSAYLYLSTREKRSLLGSWARAHRDLSQDDLAGLLDALVRGRTFQEKSALSDLLGAYPEHRRRLDPRVTDEWLDHLSGWGEVDSLCQSTFTADDLLARWTAWKRLIRKLARSPSIHKRRASLVLLTKAARGSNDARIRDLSFENIGALQHERDVLITKAVSWLLRSLIAHHRTDVARYLIEHRQTLPPVAYREVDTKLRTGRKYVSVPGKGSGQPPSRPAGSGCSSQTRKRR